MREVRTDMYLEEKDPSSGRATLGTSGKFDEAKREYEALANTGVIGDLKEAGVYNEPSMDVGPATDAAVEALRNK